MNAQMIIDRINDFVNQLRLTWALLLDVRVPLSTKLIPLLFLVYLVSPIDLIPDFLLVIGQIDDVLLAVATMRFFEEMTADEIVNDHRARLGLMRSDEQGPRPQA